MSVLPASQNKRRALYRNLFYAVFALLLATAVASRMLDVALHGIGMALAIIAFVVVILQFNAMDEVAKQAHYVAWYWGSIIALGVIAAASVVSMLAPEAEAMLTELFVPLWAGRDDEHVFVAGLLTGPLLMTVGFFAWWTVYWLRRR